MGNVWICLNQFIDHPLCCSQFYTDIYTDILVIYTDIYTDILVIYTDIYTITSLILHNPAVEIGDMVTEHHILRDRGIVIFTAVDQRLDIFSLVFLSDDGRHQPQLPLNHIHHQPCSPAIAINPWMNSHQPEVSLKAETVASRDICYVSFGYFFIEPSAEIIHRTWHLIICKITPAADTGADIT